MTEAAGAPRLLLAVAVGGAVGALARWGLTTALPDSGDRFPWTTFAVNLLGSLALALLPAIGAVRRRRVAAVALGPGLLGGFTTLSAYSEQTRALLAGGHTVLAATYLLGTLAACLVGVHLAGRWTTSPERGVLAAEGGDA